MASITQYLEIILNGKDLTFEQAKALQDTIFEGQVSEVQIAAFLAMMRMKKATSGEIAGLAQSLRDHAVRVAVDLPHMIDTCGTGGAVRQDVQHLHRLGPGGGGRRGVRRQARQPGHHQPVRLGRCAG